VYEVGGGPAGVVEGLFVNRDRRESGVEGGSEDPGTLNMVMDVSLNELNRKWLRYRRCLLSDSDVQFGAAGCHDLQWHNNVGGQYHKTA